MPKRASAVAALYAYFRGAEYPLGRLEALRAAVGMVRDGWPASPRKVRRDA